MSEHSSEAERVDESAFGDGGESSYEADIDASGSPVSDEGPEVNDSESADEAVPDSYAADVNAGYDDPADSPTLGGVDAEEDGSL